MCVCVCVCVCVCGVCVCVRVCVVCVCVCVCGVCVCVECLDCELFGSTCLQGVYNVWEGDLVGVSVGVSRVRQVQWPTSSPLRGTTTPVVRTA